MTRSSRTGQKGYWAFEEPTLINILLDWLGELGYMTIRTSNHIYEIHWGGHDTEARLEIYEKEVALYTRKTHTSIRAGIYDKEAFGTLKRLLESYAKSFENGGNVFPGHYKI